MPSRLLAICVVIVAALVAVARPADACSCGPPPPACEAFWQADAVFTAKVTDYRKGVSVLEVTRAFRGAVSGTIEIHGDGMCAASYARGEYFIYARLVDGKWQSSYCGRSTPLARAAEDLAYATAIPVRSKGVVEGMVMRIDERGRSRPAVDVEIGAKGTAFRARTDAKGAFLLSVAPGRHELEVTTPGLAVINPSQTGLEVPNAAACAHTSFQITDDGRIGGRVVDAAGAPVVGATVSAHRAGAGPDDLSSWAVTDGTGHYVIRPLVLGSYTVAVNHPDVKAPSASHPYATTFHRAAGKSAPARLSLGRAATLTGIDLVLPPALPLQTLQGQVVDKAGPLAGTRLLVEARYRGGWEQFEVTTDADGKFTVQHLRGSKLYFSACHPAHPSRCVREGVTLDRDRSVRVVITRTKR